MESEVLLVFWRLQPWLFLEHDAEDCRMQKFPRMKNFVLQI